MRTLGRFKSEMDLIMTVCGGAVFILMTCHILQNRNYKWMYITIKN